MMKPYDTFMSQNEANKKIVFITILLFSYAVIAITLLTLIFLTTVGPMDSPSSGAAHLRQYGTSVNTYIKQPELITSLHAPTVSERNGLLPLFPTPLLSVPVVQLSTQVNTAVSRATTLKSSKKRVLSFRQRMLIKLNRLKNMSKTSVSMTIKSSGKVVKPTSTKSMNLKLVSSHPLQKSEENNLAIAPLVLGGLIAAGGSLVSGAMSSAGQSSANNTNMSIAEAQNAWNLEQWNRENEYNTPSAQVQRLKDAGLNPALMYGSGATSNTSASSPRAAAASVQNPNVGYAQGISQATGMMMQTIMNQQEISKMQAQSDLAKSQADLARMNTNVGTVRSGLYAAQTAQTYSNIDVNSARISNLMSQTSLNEVRQIGQEITNENLPENYRLQQELRQTAISLNNEQIHAVSVRLAQTWKALEISEGRYQNDSSRAFWQSHLWEQQIENLRSGASLNDVKTELLRIGVGYEDANQVVGMIGKILGGVSSAAGIIK